MRYALLVVNSKTRLQQSTYQPDNTAANPARGQLNREKNIFPYPIHSRLRTWFREMGSVVWPRISPLILQTYAIFSGLRSERLQRNIHFPCSATMSRIDNHTRLMPSLVDTITRHTCSALPIYFEHKSVIDWMGRRVFRCTLCVLMRNPFPKRDENLLVGYRKTLARDAVPPIAYISYHTWLIRLCSLVYKMSCD